MPYPIENKLVIAVASSALFNLVESDSVSRRRGNQFTEGTKRNILILHFSKELHFLYRLKGNAIFVAVLL